MGEAACSLWTAPRLAAVARRLATGHPVPSSRHQLEPRPRVSKSQS